MKQRGWAPLSRKNVEVAGLPGIFLHFEQGASGIQFLKWSLVFGDDKHTVLVTAAGPKEEEPKLLELLRSAVLSTRPDESAPVDPAADVPFTLDVSKKLRLTKSISRSLAYSKDGSLPLESPKDPVFMAVSSFGKTEARDQRQFAEKRIRSTPNSKRLSVKSTKPITINGLSGFESIAEAEDAKSGTPTLIYEVMLFRDRSYFLMSGLVGKELAGEYLPEFKAMARSFRVKDLKKTR